MAGGAATATPPVMIAAPWVLSIAMLAVLALVIGGIYLIRMRRDRRQGLLMLVAAAVLLGNVLLWTWP